MRQLLEQHAAGRVLVIGEYIAQVEAIAKVIGAPLVIGKTLQASGDSQRREVAISHQSWLGTNTSGSRQATSSASWLTQKSAAVKNGEYRV